MTTPHELDGRRLPEHLDRLMKAALVLTGSPHDADDLVQETFVRVMRRPRLVRNADDLGYLLRTMRNTWLDLRRSGQAEQWAVEAQAAMLERAPGLDPLLTVEARALLAAVAELPDIQRDAIVAVDLLGLTYKQAARALRTREGTLMSRLFRARVQVGEALVHEDAESWECVR